MCITVVSDMRLLGVIRVVRAPIIEARVLLLLETVINVMESAHPQKM